MTDRVAAVAQLDPAFYQRLFADAGLPIFTCDVRGNVVACNPLGEGLLRECGFTSRSNLRDLLPVEHHADLEHNLGTLIETGEPVEFRARLSLGQAEAAQYAVWFTPIHDNQDCVECIAVWFHDITARLQLRRGMRKRERLTTLGVLAGSVAHHYNNLLCSIATSLEFALNMNTMSAMRRVLRRTADAVGRATQLTQQLLAFAQADHRMRDLADLTETLLRYFDQHESDLAARGIKIDLQWERIPFVPLPRDQLSIVIDNLVRNAVEAMPEGGVLRAGLRRRDEHSVTFWIADSGPGLSPAQMERLFEPFFTTKGELGAGETHQAGMGLAVAHGLISEMHGTISVTNVPAGGARFDIVLPLQSTQ